jgi:hypothetical protein
MLLKIKSPERQEMLQSAARTHHACVHALLKSFRGMLWMDESGGVGPPGPLLLR